MNTREKIEYLSSICKESVTITINDHYRGSGETMREYLEDRNELKNVPEDILKEMETRNFMCEVHAYPLSQVGFYCYFHYDLDEALDVVISWVKQKIQ